jgi:cyclopropane fatty-acyl-phospholipid synthase-like methyltransferase
MNKKNQFYKTHPQTCDPKDFWGQVKRTVNGKPVSEEQIQMIVDAVINALDLKTKDHLLDLCCGNGALTDRFKAHCHNIIGVDFSPSLIEIAQDNFLSKDCCDFIEQDVVLYTGDMDNMQAINKVLCYGSFQYLCANDAVLLLQNIKNKYQKIDYFFIGNVPDKSKKDIFYQTNSDIDSADDCNSAIGIWRTKDEFRQLAETTGWDISFCSMPEEYYASTYRYDVLLFPKG